MRCIIKNNKKDIFSNLTIASKDGSKEFHPQKNEKSVNDFFNDVITREKGKMVKMKINENSYDLVQGNPEVFSFWEELNHHSNKYIGTEDDMFCREYVNGQWLESVMKTHQCDDKTIYPKVEKNKDIAEEDTSIYNLPF